MPVHPTAPSTSLSADTDVTRTVMGAAPAPSGPRPQLVRCIESESAPGPGPFRFQDFKFLRVRTYPKSSGTEPQYAVKLSESRLTGPPRKRPQRQVSAENSMQISIGHSGEPTPCAARRVAGLRPRPLKCFESECLLFELADQVRSVANFEKACARCTTVGRLLVHFILHRNAEDTRRSEF